MNKYIYICGIMLLSMNMMAQINEDSNWNELLIENFDESRSYWIWNPTYFTNLDVSWITYLGHRVESDSLMHIYQFNNVQYDSLNSTMKLVAEYDSTGEIQNQSFPLPNNGSNHNSIYYGNKHYYSGALQYVKNLWQIEQGVGRFSYGYFEIRCKLPVHKGAFPAFWLYDESTDPNDAYYEEIDIFEYSRSLMFCPPNGTNPNPPTQEYFNRVFTTGIYHNLTGGGANIQNDSYARNYPLVPTSSNDLSNWHTFGCEWMPDHVFWFFDGQLVNSFFDQSHIPHHPMYLKTNYAIDSYAWNRSNNTPNWIGSDEMVIDYIRVYQLNLDCGTNENITCQSDLDNFDYKLKKSVSITSSISGTCVSSTDNVTFRVTDSFEVTGPFEVQQGGEFTVIMQECPN